MKTRSLLFFSLFVVVLLSSCSREQYTSLFKEQQLYPKHVQLNKKVEPAQKALEEEPVLMVSAETNVVNPMNNVVLPETMLIPQEYEEMSKSEQKAFRKEIKSEVKTNLKTAKKSGSKGDVDLLLLVIIAIFIPPLAVALHLGIGTEFWIDLILTLLFYLPGLIYALIKILG